DERDATLGSRERWTVNWFRLSRASAAFFAVTIAFGLLTYSFIGCDGIVESPICPFEDIVQRIVEPENMPGASAYGLGVLAVAVTWLLAAHFYYIRIFAQL